MRKYKNLIVVFVLILILLPSCKKRFDSEASEILKTLTLQQKIGQMLMVAVPGYSINKTTKKIFENYKPGSVLFFGYNLKNADQIKSFIDELQKLSFEKSKIPLFVTLDQEGGRVKRIKSGVTQFPGNMAAGISNDSKLVFKWGKILGVELRKLGINMNLAPVLDINNNPDNPVINTRSFGSNLEVVSELGVSYATGLKESGVIAVGKHFPGHGDTESDSHLTLPVIKYDLNRLRKVEFVPFQNSIENGLDVIMTAHISYPEILGNNDSATISKFFLTDILRKELNFKGIVITDDMEMNAVSGKMDIGKAAVTSILAGSDIILTSSFGKNISVIYKRIYKAIQSKKISIERINQSVKRILELKLRYKILGYKDGFLSNLSGSKFEYDMELLKEKDEINKQLSQKAIYFSGDKDLIENKEFKRIYVVKNLTLLKSIKFRESDEIFENFKELKNFKSCSCENMIIFYEMNYYKKNEYEQIVKYAKNRKLNVVFIVSGNPFKLAKNLNYGSMLISFSNTKLSLEAFGSVLNGDFKPTYNIKLNLGFRNGIKK